MKIGVLLCGFHLWAKGLNAKDIHKEMFPVYSGVCRVKRFTAGSRNSPKDVRKSQMMPDQVRKWLKQQSVWRPCCGFPRTGKAMGQVYQCYWRIYREINVFPRFECHMFYALYPFVTYLLTPPLVEGDATRLSVPRTIARDAWMSDESGSGRCLFEVTSLRLLGGNQVNQAQI
jgi:hypothetical protein